MSQQQSDNARVIQLTTVNALPNDETEAPAPGEPPYKGLTFFEEKDAHLYFGRQGLIHKLVNLLAEANKGNSRFWL